jgi:hypothetical protein
MLFTLLENAKQMTLDEIADEVKFLINGWFYNHILVADFDYVPSVKAAATPTPTLEHRYRLPASPENRSQSVRCRSDRGHPES